MDEAYKTLINNLYDERIIGYISSETKERMIKDSFVSILECIEMKLNEIYSHKKIRFAFEWIHVEKDHSGLTLHDLHMKTYGFNSEFFSDEDEDFYDESKYSMDILYNLDLYSLSLKLHFSKLEKCNLGHDHKTKRFYIYSMPKVVNIISYYMNVDEWQKDFVVNFVPNFFSDCSNVPDKQPTESTDSPDSISPDS